MGMYFGRARSNGLCAGDPIKLRGKNSVIVTMRFNFPRRIALDISACARSGGTDQAPADWQSWAERSADKHIVVEVPDPCPASHHIVNQIIGMPIIVKIGRTGKDPTARNGGTKDCRSCTISLD